MQKFEKDTEQKIFEAAKIVFIRKGMSGARMQEIADEAGINKALLHYYFRSKEKLFDAVFRDTFSQIAPKILSIFGSDKNIFEKIKLFIGSYIDLLKENPHIPIFILNELQKNPHWIIDFIRSQGVHPEFIISLINKEIKKGIIKKVKPEHLLVNIISLCIFPFAARPMIEGLIFKGKTKSYNKFLDERKKEITNFIINSIKKK